MSLKILSGKYKNRPILTSPRTELRPTKGVLRQAVFNICQNEIESCHFLDCFAGSGAMGFEALSQGASFVTFIEKDKDSCKAIYKTSQNLHVQNQISIISLEVFEALKRIKGTYSIVYIDPPYSIEENMVSLIMEALSKDELLSRDALIFLEMPFGKKRMNEPYKFSHFNSINTRKSGRSLLHEFRFQK